MEQFTPKRSEKEVTTIRIPRDILEQVDLRSAEYGLSRNEFINQCITYALKNMVEK